MAGRQVVIIGEVYDPTLSVGWPLPPSGGGAPPGIWGPTDPRPTPPIHLGPGGGGIVSPPIYYPPGIWGPTDPRPTPPIYIPPDGLAPGVPTHPIFLPVYPAHPIVIPPDSIGPGVPTHPIVLPPPQPGHPIVIPPDGIGDGVPSHPIVLPEPPLGIWGPTDPRPTPPIFLPPNTLPGVPSHPIYIPPPSPGVPTHPIVIPPPGSPDKPEVLENWDVKAYWTPTTGWGIAIVPAGDQPVPTPSRK